MNPPQDPLEDAPTAGLLESTGLAGQSARIRPGLVLAERYLVMRFLAQGGMGEIYEVEDLQLAERVALKTIRASYAHDPHALERFKREIQLARRVTHRNVCRIFEFGVHRGRDGAIAFLTMELLPGETLLEKLRRDGRLTPAQALPLVLQMAAALDAAHRAGVVHRDFKSANVVLVPGPDAAPRVVVTDFGLAQLAALEGGVAPTSDAISGTLDYMAPEQIAGQEPTPAVDVYALGVVMYELVTGARPFGSGPHGTGVGMRRGDEPPPSPRARVPDLDPLWERVILRCLAQDPSRRFRDAALVARAVAGEASQRRRWWKAGAAAAALLLALATGYPSLFPSAGPPRAAAGRRAVAVLPFKNLAQLPEAGWLSNALSEMLTTELAAGQQLRTISGEDVARMRVELALPEADTLASDTLRRIRANLGTDLVVSGSYLSSPSQLRVDVRVQDARAGETLAAVTQTGASDQVLGVVARTGARLRQALGITGLTPAQASELRASLPANPEAARLYSAGLARLRSFDALAARELLQQAVAADPSYPLAHAALAEALSRLGYEQRSREEARLALEQGGELSREERLLVEARYREMAREWTKAVEIHRVLFGFFPDDLEHGLRLAEAQKASGRPQQAFETLASLRRLPPPSAADPRLDLVEAEIHESVGDFQSGRRAARRAAERARETGALWLVAHARVLEAYASGRLGLEAEAKAAAEEARSLYLTAGDRAGVGWALNRTGNVLHQQGHLTQALRVYEEAIRIFEQIGNRGGLASLLNNISETMVMQGNLAGARQNLERAGSYGPEFREPRRAIIVTLNTTNLDAEAGAFAAADRGYREALRACQELGEKSLEASVKRHWADTLLSTGDLAGAQSLYDDALGLHRRLVNPRYAAYALFGLGKLQRDRGDPEAARASQEEALAIRQRLGDRVGMAESQVALAELLLDAGESKRAESLARDALPVLAEENVVDTQAQAGALLALALDRQGRGAEAAEAIRAANALSGRSQRPRVRLQISLVKAELRSPSLAEARQAARAARADARRRGFPGLELEARLVLAGLEEAGAEQRKSLEQDASRRGYARIARAAAR